MDRTKITTRSHKTLLQVLRIRGSSVVFSFGALWTATPQKIKEQQSQTNKQTKQRYIYIYTHIQIGKEITPILYKNETQESSQKT